MAKGNMFQGMARGKVGDVVFYRMNGVQMARVRNRTPKNPRTNEQLYQRAIIASVMKMYSAGKEIFDHAFQGYTIGEGCMRRFNSVNARILRSQVVNDIDTGQAENKQMGRIVGPKSLYFSPMIGCQISEGTLTQNLWQRTEAAFQGGIMKTTWKINRLTFNGTDDKVVDWFNALGIYAGDIFTWCFGCINIGQIFIQLPGVNNAFSSQFEAAFQWLRLTVKSNISDTLTIAGATFADVFDVEMSDGPLSFDASNLLVSSNLMTLALDWDIVTTGIIRSREDVDLRSTSYMYFTGSNQYGIISSYIIPLWAEDVTKIGESELILEGGDGPALGAGGRRSIEDELIIPADVNEAEVPTTARHRGTRNNSK